MLHFLIGNLMCGGDIGYFVSYCPNRALCANYVYHPNIVCLPCVNCSVPCGKDIAEIFRPSLLLDLVFVPLSYDNS